MPHIWLQAIFLMCSSKKGISANQLHRTLGVQLKTAWFVGHRIRKAMETGTVIDQMRGVVEIDETFFGRKKDVPVQRGTAHKHAVLSLVERGGKVRSVHVPDIKAKTVVPIVEANVAKESRVMTDDGSQYYRKLGGFADHGTVNHSGGEYVVPGTDIHTNTVESFFSVFKRGMRGVYQHCDERHLHRYVSEFDFRHNHRKALGIDDQSRTVSAIDGVKGKRLKYKDGIRKSIDEAS